MIASSLRLGETPLPEMQSSKYCRVIIQRLSYPTEVLRCSIYCHAGVVAILLLLSLKKLLKDTASPNSGLNGVNENWELNIVRIIETRI